ncbi:MAG TPA: D-alanine--D-alanine ligase [Polyangiaceae bacterium]|nr:D-alanine--D-alanine ligase [Polyangiaceae bacterium]
MNSGKIGVIMGGTSAERDVSLTSGRAVVAALEDAGKEVVPVVIEDGPQALAAVLAAKIDRAFLALHGRLGEDGCVQGLLEILGIPYTGSSVLASALAMDKVKAKELFRLHNVPTPPYYVFDAKDCAGDLEEIHGSFGFPVVVKPRREGSSIGVSKAKNLAELAMAIEQALLLDDSVLVERFIQGKEIAVGILDGRVLGAVEIVPKSGMYDYEAKYTPGATEYHCPARLPATRSRGVLNLGERAAEALGTTGAVRVDLLVTEGQNEYVLEVNTLPGMTPTSLLPKIAASVGFRFSDLCVAITDRARLHTAQVRQKASVVRFEWAEDGAAEDAVARAVRVA